jgi:hypothetical protein
MLSTPAWLAPARTRGGRELLLLQARTKIFIAPRGLTCPIQVEVAGALLATMLLLFAFKLLSEVKISVAGVVVSSL